LEDLRKINKNKIFVVHINDAEDMPKEKLTDADRILPGLGVIPLRQFLQALKKTGYNHMASIELFRPEYYEWDPLELARRAKEATEAVLTEA
jgi:2-keto-myo-inositol isomerase